MTSREGGPAHTELQEKSFEASQVTINYAEGPPSGSPLVFLHGIGRNWKDFLPLIPSFASRWQVFALDFRGHGSSGREANYRSRDYAGDVIEFLDHVVCRPAAMFGHSLGGAVTMHVAANRPELVRAAILGDTVFSGKTLAESMYQPLFAGLYEVIVQNGSIGEMAGRLGKVRIPVPGIGHLVAIGDLPGNNAPSLLKWAECLQQVAPEAMRMSRDGLTLSDFDGRELIARMQCPTLILQANPQLGGLVPDREIDFARTLPHVRVARFPLLGHALHLQQAKPVADAVLEFLNTVTQS